MTIPFSHDEQKNQRPSNGTLSGVEMIAQERKRQIERWSDDHDDSHRCGELALVAALYATPVQLYAKQELLFPWGTLYSDPWPNTWSRMYDKRQRHTRERNLVIAGALIAAELDRLQRGEGDRR